MASIFSLYGEIFVDNEKATKGIEDTKTKAEKAKESFQNLSKSCMDLSKKMTLGFTAGVAAITGIVESTKEYRNTMSGLETSFKTAGLEADDATNTYKSLYSVLGDTGKAKEAAQFIGLMAKNEKDLATWTDICTGVYAKFGDALPIEGLTEAANETVKVGQVTGVLADALNWVGISEDEFNEKLSACSDEQEREQLIRETLNDTYKEASDVYKETNESIIQNNESQANLTENLSNIAEIFEPLVTKGKEFLKVNSMGKAIAYFASFVFVAVQLALMIFCAVDASHKQEGLIMDVNFSFGALSFVAQECAVNFRPKFDFTLYILGYVAFYGLLIGTAVLIAGMITSFNDKKGSTVAFVGGIITACLAIFYLVMAIATAKDLFNVMDGEAALGVAYAIATLMIALFASAGGITGSVLGKMGKKPETLN